MENTPRENSMEEELAKLRFENSHRTKVGMTELLIRQVKDLKNSGIEAEFVSSELKPRDFRFPLEKKKDPASMDYQSVDSKVTNSGLSEDKFKELMKVIRRWERKSKFCLKAGDSISSAVYSDCSKTLYEIVHRTRKASVRNGLKKKNKE